MKWKLILQLSLFGLAMGIGTVFVIPSTIEPLFWLAIFILCACIIAKPVPGKHFLHGFFVSLVNCVWVTGRRERSATVLFSVCFCSAGPRGLCGDLRLFAEPHYKPAGPRINRVALRYMESSDCFTNP